MLEEARDRQPREIGIALDDLLARRLGDEHRLERRLQRVLQERPETAFVDAERLGDERAPGQQIRDERQLAAVHARDAHRVAVERDETCGEPGRRVERLADLDQPAVVRELREPRPQRLRVTHPAPSSPERTSATTSPRSGPIESPAATKS